MSYLRTLASKKPCPESSHAPNSADTNDAEFVALDNYMDPIFSSNEPQRARIEFIDGLRGVAIIVVILFHAFARWPELYIYGNKFIGNPVFDTKVAGVNLFFIISGFVILMTLRKCRGFFDFITRRWYRLFPAMLVCSILVLTTSGLFPERPSGAIGFWDLLPGLTFSGDGGGTHHLWDPLASYIGVPISSIEGAFWSLYVEARFYIVFGAAYFLLGEHVSIGIVFFLFILSVLSSERLLDLHFGPSDIGGRVLASLNLFLSKIGVRWLSDFLTSKAYGFFAAGALFFLFYITRKKGLFWLAVAAGLLTSISQGTRGANICLTLLFALAISCSWVRRILESNALVFIGFISYPLYLLHENMMVAMIVKVGRAFPSLPPLLIPVFPICIVLILAWIIAKYIEPATKAFLDVRSMPVVVNG